MYGFLDQHGGGVAGTVKDSCLLSERLVVSKACSAIADFSVSPLGCLVLHSNASPVPSLFPRCTLVHSRRGCRKPLLMVSVQGP